MRHSPQGHTLKATKRLSNQNKYLGASFSKTKINARIIMNKKKMIFLKRAPSVILLYAMAIVEPEAKGIIGNTNPVFI